MPAMKATGLEERLYSYLVARRTPDDEVIEELRSETEKTFHDQAGMLISPVQGTFLRILVAAMGARRVIEVGTFTGYSALSMARGLPENGYLLTLDVSEEYTAIARSYWKRAGVANRIELRLAPALETLRALPLDDPFDFAFIDARKSEYPEYYEEILRRLRAGGLIAVDNVLWSGRVIQTDVTDTETQAIRDFNDQIAADDRVESVMVPIADGLTLIRKP
jgi:caffeoyl-CoA O-methyltransferase